MKAPGPERMEPHVNRVRSEESEEGRVTALKEKRQKLGMDQC